MLSAATGYKMVSGRRRRGFFGPCNTQQVRSRVSVVRDLAREVARALTALGGAAAWAAVLLLLAG